MNMRRIVLASVLGIGLALAGTSAALAHSHSGQGMMQQGQGPMMGQGQGMMMQPGMMGQGMGPGMMMGMHPGMMGMHAATHGKGGGINKLLSVDEAKEWLGTWLTAHLGERVKVGTIEVEGVFAIAAEVVTVDGSLVQNVVIDRRDGSVWRAE
jgi:hypothetical protein